MNKKVWKPLLGVLALVFVLAACNTQVKPQMSQASFDQSWQEYQANLGAVAAEVGQDLALQALMNQPAGAPGINTLSLAAAVMKLGPQTTAADALGLLGEIAPLADNNLERGKYDYDSTNGWESDPNYTGDDLVLTWNFDDDQGDSHLAELTFDWNYGAATVDVRERDGSTSEMPQDMMVTLKVDGSVVGSLRGQFGWYSCNGAPIAEPTSVAINGSAGANDRIEFSFNLSAGDSRISTSGSFSATSGGDSASFSWNVSADGQMQRDGDCFSTGFDVTAGHVDFQTSETVGGETSSFAFNTDFTLNFDASGNPVSAGLSNGFIKVDGAVAVTFSGTLDDANNNCVPGENVTLVFADGSMSLEQYLIAQGATPGCD